MLGINILIIGILNNFCRPQKASSCVPRLGKRTETATTGIFETQLLSIYAFWGDERTPYPRSASPRACMRHRHSCCITKDQSASLLDFILLANNGTRLHSPSRLLLLDDVDREETSLAGPTSPARILAIRMKCRR